MLVSGTLTQEFGLVCPMGGRLRCASSSLKNTPAGTTMTVDLSPLSPEAEQPGHLYRRSSRVKFQGAEK